MKQMANTIVLEMEGTKGEDIRDLSSGHGKILRRVNQVLKGLKEEGQTPEDAQPVIVVVRKKGSSRKGLLD